MSSLTSMPCVVGKVRWKEAAKEIPTVFGSAKYCDRELYRVEHRGHRVFWIPNEAVELQKPLLVCVVSLNEPVIG